MTETASRLILLVEDEAIIALSQKQILEQAGYSVDVAHNAEQAVDAALSSPGPDLILMDIDLGSGMDGTMAAQRILADKEVPIVFLTSHAEQEMVNRVKDITRYGYILKSAGKSVLLETIEMAFELYASHRAMQNEIKRHRETEQELRARNAFIETVLENLPIGLAVNYIDEGSATYMNRKFEEVYGWPQDVITNIRSFFEHVYPDPEHRAAVQAQVEADIKSGNPERMEWTNMHITRSDGSRAYVDAKNIPLPEQNLMISTVQDISDSVRAAESLRESEARYRALAENLPNGLIATFDHVLCYTAASGEAFKDGPLSADDFVGRRLRDIFPAEIADRDEPALRAALDGERRDQLISYQGNTHRVITTPVTDDAGAIVGGMVLTQDVTKLSSVQAELERMVAERDFLIRETNHRIKNNLLTIDALLQFAERGRNVDFTDIRRQVEMIQSVQARLSGGEFTAEIFLKPLLHDVLNSFRDLEEEGRFTVGESIKDVCLSPKAAVPIGLLVNELVTNAVKHGVSGAPGARIDVSLQEIGRRVRIEVANTGNSFPDDVDLAHPPSVGLQLITTLTDQLDGTIHLERSPNTRFVTEIPAGEPPSRPDVSHRS